jgi:hypothetical protein
VAASEDPIPKPAAELISQPSPLTVAPVSFEFTHRIFSDWFRFVLDERFEYAKLALRDRLRALILGSTWLVVITAIGAVVLSYVLPMRPGWNPVVLHLVAPFAVLIAMWAAPARPWMRFVEQMRRGCTWRQEPANSTPTAVDPATAVEVEVEVRLDATGVHHSCAGTHTLLEWRLFERATVARETLQIHLATGHSAVVIPLKALADPETLTRWQEAIDANLRVGGFDADSRVRATLADSSITCGKCGHDLRGIPAARCGECGIELFSLRLRLFAELSRPLLAQNRLGPKEFGLMQK